MTTINITENTTLSNLTTNNQYFIIASNVTLTIESTVNIIENINYANAIAASGDSSNTIISNVLINNSGSITAESPYNNIGTLYIYRAIIDIINTGTILNSNNTYDISAPIPSSSNHIINLHNLQNGLKINNITPSNYYTIIQNDISYGSIIISNPAGTNMSFNIDPTSTINPTFIYTNIIVGLPIANITNNSGTFNGMSWNLESNTSGPANSYNLVFSLNVSNIASSRFNDNIYTLNSIYTSLTQELIISPTQKLIIPRGFSLDISSNGGGQIDNSGAIINYGTITIDGPLNSTGIINNEFGGTVTNNNTLNNNGKFLNRHIYNSQGFIYGNLPLNVNGGTYNSLKLVACADYGNIYTNAIYVNGPWTQQASVEVWTSITSSASGQFLAACVGGEGNIYTSNDYGITWIPSSQIETADQDWASIASSASGQFLVAGVQDGGIYTNNNYGEDGLWVQQEPPDENWLSLASSESGQFLVAGIYGDPFVGTGAIYTNNNYGDGQWVQQALSPANNVRSIASDASGQFLVACVNPGTIYTSNDYGITWLPSNAPSVNWLSVACSASGQYVVACYITGTGTGGGIYISSNYGANWSITSAPSLVWLSVASSDSGQYLVACYNIGTTEGGIYISSNYGANWSITSAPSQTWSSVASSSY